MTRPKQPMKTISRLFALTCLSCGALSVQAADTADVLNGLVGYTVVLSATITGYIDSDGKREDSFNGCAHGRVIIFDNNKGLTCATYSYTYSYHPSAVVLSNGSSYKMVVGDEIYDMRR